jgi:uncharacterized protein (DUF4415 family)
MPHNFEHSEVTKGSQDHRRDPDLYKNRDTSRDRDPEYHKPLPPDQWSRAMSREELWREVKKQTTVRIDADILEWLKSKGKGHLTRINDILRDSMREEIKPRTK